MHGKKNIVLIGFMGAGKSLISKHLAEKLHLPVIETDACIIEREKKSISDIFKDSGEAYFRKVECSVVAEVSEKENVIVDCGGGVVLNPVNLEKLRRNGTAFFLHASPEETYRRIKNETHRPLLKVKDPLARIKEMLKERMPFYKQADYTIETDQRDVNQICTEILGKLKK